GVDKTNKTKGTVWSVGLSRIAGSNIDNPVEAISLDELLFVVKKSSNLYFDEELPGWHMYGTDIVWEALKKKMNSYIINAPVIHNSLPIFYFDKDFKKSYFFIRKKWRKHLPIKTTCVMISRFALKFLIKNKINQIRNVKNKRNNYKRCCNPVKLAVELGYENA
ncbi:MAG: hypothetical protein GX587_08380, partial [Bacteroidales bacterium]|nr:hypothetical protein [Bacteroidales bacterium]